ncbi:hypothetical protein ACFVY5_22125, partial [Streptomyces parvulus]
MAESGVSALTPTPRALVAHPSLARAEQFVWRTARVLEQRLFAYHFRGGDAAPVETALDAYRNEDGGYGHALEPDLHGPASGPAHTARALRVLDAVGRCGGQRVERMCRFLTSASTPDGALPAVPSAGSGEVGAGGGGGTRRRPDRTPPPPPTPPPSSSPLPPSPLPPLGPGQPVDQLDGRGPGRAAVE